MLGEGWFYLGSRLVAAPAITPTGCDGIPVGIGGLGIRCSDPRKPSNSFEAAELTLSPGMMRAASALGAVGLSRSVAPEHPGHCGARASW